VLKIGMKKDNGIEKDIGHGHERMMSIEDRSIKG
jgi:hypothetical protein